MVQFSTSMGDFKVELYPEKAPLTVTNFLEYVDEGHYKGVIFHRVIDGFMVQAGGFDKDFNEKPTHEPVKNESHNGLSNAPMTLAMARLPDPDSARAQFFINLVDNSRLDGGSQPGYTVFGKVIEGEDTIRKIAKVPTGDHGVYQNVPLTPVVINEVKIIKK